jgi:hypothetical protein
MVWHSGKATIARMKPATAIATALALGAALLKEGGDEAAVEAYVRLKELITRRYVRVRLARLEQEPNSKALRDAVARNLAEAGTDRDQEVLRQAKELIDVLRPRDLEAALTLEAALADGCVFVASEVRCGGDIEIGQVRVGRDAVVVSAGKGSVAAGRDVVIGDKVGRDDVVSSGYLAYNPPKVMRVGRSETIEARVARDMLPQLILGMSGRGETRVETTPVAALMWAELDGNAEAFGIEGNRERPQWVDHSTRGYASWSWRVMPLSAGAQVLTLRLLGHRIAADGQGGELAFDPVERQIRVRVNPARALRRVAAWLVPLAAAAMLGALAEDGVRAAKQHLAWPEAESTTPPSASSVQGTSGRRQ